MAGTVPSVVAPSTYEHRRNALHACLDAAADVTGVDEKTRQWLRGKLLEESFNFVVAGQFKRGKSSVINALLGAAVLPVGVLPLTSIVTILRHGPEPRVQVHFEDGRDLEVGTEALQQYVTERGNPQNDKRVRQVVVEYPSAWLADGVRLIDTPGIGSVYEHNTGVTRAYLPRADAVLFVTSADQPVSRAELEFLDTIREHADRIICLLNKSDYLAPADLIEAVTFSRQVLAEALGEAVPIFPVSAKLALARTRSEGAAAVGAPPYDGFAKFEHALRQFLNQERRATWLRAIGRSLERLLAQARFAAELERDALQAPLERISAGLEMLRDKSAAIRRAQDDYMTLLEKESMRLLHERVEPRLHEFRDGQTRRLVGAVDAWAVEFASLAGARLQAALQERSMNEIRSACDRWRAHEESELATAFDAACARFWHALQLDIDDLLRACGELFHVSFSAIGSDSLWQLDSDFSYKFWSEPPVLRMLSSSLVQALPDFLGRRLVVERARRTIADLMDTQSGRLRADFDERLRNSRQQFVRRMTTVSDTLLTRLDAAIESALTLRRASETNLNLRRQVLTALIESVVTLESRVRAAVFG